MHLVLVAERRLATVYGADYPILVEALQEALNARSAAGIESLRYDPEVGLPDLLVPAALLEPEPLTEQLQHIEAVLAQQGAIIESLWIIGGPTVIPFGALPNPMPDSDGAATSDAIYGLADVGAPLPRWPVGRTPDQEPPKAGLLPLLLQHVAAAHRAGSRPPGTVSALTAQVWGDVSEVLLADVADVSSAQIAPALQGQPDLDAFFAARRMLCNLHGVRRETAWLGQVQFGGPHTPALRASDPARYDLRGKLLISQACYGARLSRINGAESLAPVLLAAGLAALIAPPGLAYGAFDPPPVGSDLLAAYVLHAFAQPDRRIGTAFLEAQTALLRAALLRGGPDADEMKTLLGFVLYADPALCWT